MSFIQKSDAVVINTKLTSIGRQLLSVGALTFSKIEFGDSEVDYDFLRDNSTIITGSDLIIMRPKDLNPPLKYGLPITEGLTETKATLGTITSNPTLVTNTAKSRGFFTGSTTNGFTALTSTTYIKGITTLLTSGVTGGSIINVASAANISANTMLLIDWRNPKLSGITSTTGVIGESYPRQFLWYKAISVNSNAVTVDRNVPNFNFSGGTSKSVVYIYPPNNAVDNYYSTGTTVSYWNYNTLSFDSTCNIGTNDDVPVWNFNIVYNKTVPGVQNDYAPQYYDSAIFSGFKEYIEGSGSNSGNTQLGIIHYTNKSISNYYGEGFYNTTFRLTLPTIMYHAKTSPTMGIVLSASTKKTQPTNLTGFTTEYCDLIETTSQNVVGKVFNDLRIALIEDQEILNALSLKGDRSHTLPKMQCQLINSTTDSILSKYTTVPTKYLALTYLLSAGTYNPTKSYGFNGGIHCGYIQYFNQSTASEQNVRFNFNSDDLKFMVSSISASGGTGFNVNRFYLLAQLVNYGTDPNPKTWKLIDFTTGLTNYNTWSATTMPPSTLSDSVYTLKYSNYTAGTTYDISNIIGTLPASPTYTSSLGFGEESILLGNVDTSIKATVFKTKVSQTLNFNNYNTSNNPTFEDGDDVYVTEAGIYDANNNLVAVGKLNNPVKKNTNKLFTIELDMDF